jgi:hypothetical protein
MLITFCFKLFLRLNYYSAWFESWPGQPCLDVYRGVFQPLQANAGILSRLGHDHFLPNLFQFIRQSYRWIPYSLDIDKSCKKARNPRLFDNGPSLDKQR